MPSEKEIRENPSNVEDYMKFLKYNKEMVSDKKSDLELSNAEQTVKDFLDLEIEKMVQPFFMCF